MFLRIPKGQGRARALAEEQHSAHRKAGDEELGNYCLANKSSAQVPKQKDETTCKPTEDNKKISKHKHTATGNR